MRLFCLVMVSLLMGVAILTSSGRAAPQDLFPPKVLPNGVVEVVGLGCRSLIELKDGSLLASNGRVSADGGLTWTEPRPFAAEGAEDISPYGTSLLRLNSGALALVYRGQGDTDATGAKMWLSEDESNTWGPPRSIKLQGGPYHDTMIQLSSGRLLYPSRIAYSGSHHTDLKSSGHTTIPEMCVSSIHYSDDLGQRWKRAPGYLIGWFDYLGTPNGDAGMTACDEPCVAETADGRVLFFARSQAGRVVYSYSSDEGERWTAVRPTELASSFSPSRLRRIPATGDLICVWNQVSAEEIERRDWRGRLSVAISQDSGETWGHFKTIELAPGMADMAHITPELPIKWRRIDQREGKRSSDYFCYANVRFVGDKVYVIYKRGRHEKKEGKTVLRREMPLRINPLEWFYE